MGVTGYAGRDAKVADITISLSGYKVGNRSHSIDHPKTAACWSVAATKKVDLCVCVCVCV